MKAISLWQPWASAIIVGIKQYETRSWPLKYRGELAIHACRGNNEDVGRALTQLNRECDRFKSAFGSKHGPFPIGQVLGVVRVVDCVEAELVSHTIDRDAKLLGHFAPGRWAWRLEVIERFEEPVPAKGHQGLWDWQPERRTK